MKCIIFFLVFLFLFFPLVSSFEFNLKQEINQGETLMATLSGNFLEPILKENIFFYQAHVRVAFNFDIAKIDDKYYIYASSLGKSPNNYSIEIKKLKSRLGYEVIERDFVQNFSIKEEWADFAVIPGFIVTEDDFYIEIQNLKISNIKVKIDSNIKVENDIKLLSIETGEIERVNFEIKNSDVSMYEKVNLSYGNTTYEIPIYLYKMDVKTKDKEEKFRFEPLEFNLSMTTNSNTTRIFYVYNYGNTDLENISLSLSDSLKQYISLSKNEITGLSPFLQIKKKVFREL